MSKLIKINPVILKEKLVSKVLPGLCKTFSFDEPLAQFLRVTFSDIKSEFVTQFFTSQTCFDNSLVLINEVNNEIIGGTINECLYNYYNNSKDTASINYTFGARVMNNIIHQLIENYIKQNPNLGEYETAYIFSTWVNKKYRGNGYFRIIEHSRNQLIFYKFKNKIAISANPVMQRIHLDNGAKIVHEIIHEDFIFEDKKVLQGLRGKTALFLYN